MIVSVIFHIGAQPLHTPFMETSEDEYQYYRYAAARLSDFSNITWDLGNEHETNGEHEHTGTGTKEDTGGGYE